MRSAPSSRSRLDGGAARSYVSVDGGMSDNIRTALYDADYSCTLASRGSDAEPVLGRVVGKHCEAGDILVKDEFVPGDVVPGRPARGARDRRLLPLDGQQLQPRTAAAGDQLCGTGSRASSYAVRLRPTCCLDGCRAGERVVSEADNGGKVLKVALLGCGSVGSQVVRLLSEQAATSPRGSAPAWSWSAWPYAASTRRARWTCPPTC